MVSRMSYTVSAEPWVSNCLKVSYSSFWSDQLTAQKRVTFVCRKLRDLFPILLLFRIKILVSDRYYGCVENINACIHIMNVYVALALIRDMSQNKSSFSSSSFSIELKFLQKSNSSGHLTGSEHWRLHSRDIRPLNLSVIWRLWLMIFRKKMGFKNH